jgi:hypothetical protein
MRTARTTAGVVATLLLAGCGAGSSAPHLRVATDYQTLTVKEAFADTPYDVGLGRIEALDGQAVTLRDIRFDKADGLRSTTGWLTDVSRPGSIVIGSDIGDLRHRVPQNEFVELSGATVEHGGTRQWYLLVSVVPGRTGDLTPKDVVVRYRDADGHDGTVRIPFELTIHVTHTGSDPEAAKVSSA